jgi:hypothetical protein
MGKQEGQATHHRRYQLGSEMYYESLRDGRAARSPSPRIQRLRSRYVVLHGFVENQRFLPVATGHFRPEAVVQHSINGCLHPSEEE